MLHDRTSRVHWQGDLVPVASRALLEKRTAELRRTIERVTNAPAPLDWTAEANV